MIDGSEKRNRQLAFELQNSHLCEKRSNKLEIPHKSCWKDITDFKLRKNGHHSIYLNVYLTSSPFLKRRKNNYALTLTHR